MIQLGVCLLLSQGSLIEYYKLDETAAGPVVDAAGGNNNGTITNAPTFGAAGTIGTAFTFDGVNDVFRINNTMSGTFTLSLWIRTTQTGLTGTQAYEGNGILWSDVGGAAADMVPLALINGGHLAFLTSGTGGDVTLETTASVNDGAWHHVLVTRDVATGAKSIRVDGGTAVTATGSTDVLNANATIDVGGNTLDNRYFAGTLDEIRIYNAVLSAAEQAELAGGPFPPLALNVTGTVGGVGLAWSAPAGGLTYTYTILRRPAGTGAYAAIGTSGAALSYTDSSGTPSTSYDYRVVAVSSVGDSRPSNSVTAAFTPAPRTDDHEEGILGDRCGCGTSGGPAAPLALLLLAALVAATKRTG